MARALGQSAQSPPGAPMSGLLQQRGGCHNRGEGHARDSDACQGKGSKRVGDERDEDAQGDKKSGKMSETSLGGATNYFLSTYPMLYGVS